MHEFKYVFGRGTKSNSKYECCMYATIQGMEQAIQSIDAFATDTVLQGKHIAVQKHFCTNLSTFGTRNHLFV